MADLEQTIRDAVESPQSATVDGTSATARSIADLIEADKYLATKAAGSSRKPGFRVAKILPPGMSD